MAGLRVGVLVDASPRQQPLQHMARMAGHQVVVSLNVQTCKLSDLEQAVDAWIVDSDTLDEETLTNADGQDAVTWLLEHAVVPVILAHSHELVPGSVAYADWLRRIAERLERLSGDVNLQQANTAPYVWILAASTGGPAAVKEFLSGVMANADIAFVYVQHIDSQYTHTLLRMMSGAGHYPAFTASHGRVLQAGELLLVDASSRVELLDNGTFRDTRAEWGGDYAPAIDQVVANIARIYRERCGLIVFTGMGSDGAAGARMVRQWDGQVWVQSPSSCTSASMPEAVIDSITVDFEGTPAALAEQLNAYMKAISATGHSPHESTTAAN